MSSEVIRKEPAHYRYDGRTERDRLAEGEAMLRDRSMGMTLVQLMDKYGYSPPTVKERLNDALAARLATTVDAYREQVNDTLDMMMVKHGETLEFAESLMAEGVRRTDPGLVERGMNLRLQALKSMNLVLDRRAKLNGLDAPVKFDAQVTEVSQADRELQERIRAAKALARDTHADTADSAYTGTHEHAEASTEPHLSVIEGEVDDDPGSAG